MGVCCIVFDIDGMLFEFFMNFLNIEKKYILRIFFFKIKIGGGGVGVCCIVFDIDGMLFEFFFSKFQVFFTFHAISKH